MLTSNPVFTASDFLALLPELLAFAGGTLVLGLDIVFRKQRDKRILEAVSAACLGLAAVWLLGHLHSPATAAFGRLAVADPLANASRLGLAVVGLMTLVLARQQGARLGLLHGEFYGLLLYSIGAMMLFCSSTNLMLSFIALETFSLGMYVLAGFNKAFAGNREAAIKYFLLGAFAAAFFLLGTAFIFGATGSVNLADLSATFNMAGLASERLLLLQGGVLLVLVAFAFKVGLAPFHLWVPDVYEGAPTPVTAFLSAGAKFAAFGGLVRLFQSLPAQAAPFPLIVGILAVLTLLAGNLGALKQQGLKRLLAYSSIAHSGYALVGLLGMGVDGGSAANAVLVYVLVYGVMNFLAFALLASVELQLDSPDGKRTALISDIQGLGFERPWFGLAVAVTMVSMAGLPPTAGFFAKFGVFAAALEGGHRSIAVLAILNSVVSAAVYLRVLVALYMLPKEAGAQGPRFTWPLAAAALAGVLVLLWLGVLPASLAAFGRP